MFTRCPECETTFRLGAEDLRRAQGKVRCGDCGSVFNALEYLAEESEQAEEPPKLTNHADSSIPMPVDLAPVDDENSDPSADPEASLTSDEDDAYDDYDEPDESANILVIEDDEEDSTEFAVDIPDTLQPLTDDDHGPANEQWPEDTVAETNDGEVASLESPAQDSADGSIADDTGNAIVDFTIGSNDFAETPGNYAEQLESEAKDDLAADQIDAVNTSDDMDSAPEAESDQLSADTDLDSDPENSPYISFSDDDDAEAATADQDDAEPDSTDLSAAANSDDPFDFDDSIWERIPGVGSDAAASNEPEADVSSDPFADFSAPQTSTDETDNDIDAATAEPSDNEAELQQDGIIAADNNTPDEQDEDVDEWVTFEESPEDPADASSNVDNDAPSTEDKTSADTTESASSADDESEEPSHDDSLEFNAPQDTWGNIFTKTSKTQLLTADDEAADAAAPDEADEEMAALSQVFDEASDTASGGDDTADAVWEGTLEQWENSSDEHQADATDEQAAEQPEDNEEDLVSDDYDVQHIVLADESEGAEFTPVVLPAAEDDLPPWQPGQHESAPEKPARTRQWFAGGAVMLALLALQLVHYNRDALAANVGWGETIRSTYASLGLQLYPQWAVNDYEIRGSEAVAGESGPEVMDIRAQIAAIGDNPTGLPHLRVVLRDRWSNPVAAKQFSPQEYADPENIPADGMLQPGSSIAAHIGIVDPGAGAQGFELELCVPRRHTGLDCTGQPFK